MQGYYAHVFNAPPQAYGSSGLLQRELHETLKTIVAQSTGVVDLAWHKSGASWFKPKLNEPVPKLNGNDISWLVDALVSNPKITVLNISNNVVNSFGAEHLAEIIKKAPHITKIIVTGNPLGRRGCQVLSNALLERAIARASSLNQLAEKTTVAASSSSSASASATAAKATTSKISVPAPLVIEGMDTLDLSTIKYIPEENILGMLFNDQSLLTTITRLILRNWIMNTEEMVDVVNFVTKSTALRELDLGSVNMFEEDAVMLLEGLVSNTAVTTLNVSGSATLAACMQTVGKLLLHNTTLKEFDISAIEIDMAGLLFLNASLSGTIRNQFLTTLNLSGNSMLGNEGIKVVADVLKTNTTITDLLVNDCKFTHSGAKELAAALSTNNTLQGLAMDDNQIGLDGARAFATALRTNKSLQKLFVAGCGISDEGVEALVGDEKSDKDEKGSINLALLSIGRNAFTDMGAKYLANYLGSPQCTLTEFALIGKSKPLDKSTYDVQVTDVGVKLIATALKNNRRLTTLILPTGYVHSDEVLPTLLRENKNITKVNMTFFSDSSCRNRASSQLIENRDGRRCWRDTVATIAFVRASRASNFRSSILALLPTIDGLVGDQDNDEVGLYCPESEFKRDNKITKLFTKKYFINLVLASASSSSVSSNTNTAASSSANTTAMVEYSTASSSGGVSHKRKFSPGPT